MKGMVAVAAMALIAGAATAARAQTDADVQFCRLFYPGDASAIEKCLHPPPPPPAPPPVPFGQWADENLQDLGWTPLARGEEIALYMRPGPRPPGSTRLVWTRWERRRDTSHIPPALSTLSLVEVDCATGRARFRQNTTYAKNQMQGEAVSEALDAAWEYPVPDTMLALIATRTCSTPAAKPAAKAPRQRGKRT